MHHLSRRLAAAALTAAALAQPDVTPSDAPAIKLIAAADGEPLALQDPAGRFLAIHFRANLESPDSLDFVRDYLAHAPAVAGVRHVFASPAEAETVRAWAAQLGDDAGAVYLDPGGAGASALEIRIHDDEVATVVFDPAGHELFRHAGRGHKDHLTFNTFAAMLADKAAAPALAHYNLPKGGSVAVQGYDVVAYFTSATASKGRPDLASMYRGVTYHFATDANRRLFAADPERYLPTYGGWCASAMGAKGTKVEIDPKNFKVKEGRLFLFYKSAFGDALKDWNKHEQQWEPAADTNWKKLTGEGPIAPRT